MTIHLAVGRVRAQDADRHVGRRMRERRIMLGMTQQHVADLIGVTYQQEHKYEKGVNRVSAGRLYKIAQALGVDANYFFEGLAEGRTKPLLPYRRVQLEVAQDFMKLNVRQQQAVATFVRALVNGQAD